jgi:alpha-beta hydrolase superfamily lysophospholipase
MNHQENYIYSQDQTKIYYQTWGPKDEKDIKNIFTIVHGFGEHSSRYNFFVDYFVPKGTKVYALDLRGHGKSDGTRTYIDKFSEYLDDVETLVKVVKKENENSKVPIYLLGHSMGGLIASRYSQDRDMSIFKGLVLSSPFIAPKMKVPAWKLIVAPIMSKIWGRFAEPTGLPSSDLSHDNEVVEKYDNDPLVIGTATARWFTEVTANQDTVLEKAPGMDFPTLLIQAGDDRIVDNEKSDVLFDKIGSKNKVKKVMEGFFHENFNEIEKDKAFEVIKKWI